MDEIERGTRSGRCLIRMCPHLIGASVPSPSLLQGFQSFPRLLKAFGYALEIPQGTLPAPRLWSLHVISLSSLNAGAFFLNRFHRAWIPRTYLGLHPRARRAIGFIRRRIAGIDAKAIPSRPFDPKFRKQIPIRQKPGTVLNSLISQCLAARLWSRVRIQITVSLWFQWAFYFAALASRSSR